NRCCGDDARAACRGGFDIPRPARPGTFHQQEVAKWHCTYWSAAWRWRRSASWPACSCSGSSNAGARSAVPRSTVRVAWALVLIACRRSSDDRPAQARRRAAPERAGLLVRHGNPATPGDEGRDGPAAGWQAQAELYEHLAADAGGRCCTCHEVEPRRRRNALTTTILSY